MKRTIRELADLVVIRLKENNDKRFWGFDDFFKGIELSSKENNMKGEVLNLLTFYKAIRLNEVSFSCWENSYYIGDK